MARRPVAKETMQEIYAAVPHLLRLPTGKVWVDYDQETDVLYLSLKRPQRATDTEYLDEEGVLLRYRGQELVGDHHPGHFQARGRERADEGVNIRTTTGRWPAPSRTDTAQVMGQGDALVGEVGRVERVPILCCTPSRYTGIDERVAGAYNEPVSCGADGAIRPPGSWLDFLKTKPGRAFKRMGPSDLPGAGWPICQESRPTVHSRTRWRVRAQGY
ncbi:MAG: DUF2283 domain-containing protein [Chloroflexi bacterium]|nr:DUF2283 domain-containing protein [Chloroflexota bacterium]